MGCVHIGHFCELYTNAKPRAAVYDSPISLQFVFIDPDADGELRALLQRNWHFDKAAANANVHCLPPNGSRLSGGLELNRDSAFQSRAATPVNGLTSVRQLPPIPDGVGFHIGIRSFGGKRSVPNAFVLGDIHQAHLPCGHGTELSDPLNAEAAFLLTLADADHFARLQSGLYAVQTCASVADIETVDILRKHLSVSIGTEDPDWNPDRMPGLAPIAHKLEGRNEC